MSAPTYQELAETLREASRLLDAVNPSSADKYAHLAGLASENAEEQETLRDKFAGQALQGYLAGSQGFAIAGVIRRAEAAYKQADAMMEARKK